METWSVYRYRSCLRQVEDLIYFFYLFIAETCDHGQIILKVVEISSNYYIIDFISLSQFLSSIVYLSEF